METIDGALTTNAFVVVRPVAPTPSLRAAVFSNDPPAQPQAAAWWRACLGGLDGGVCVECKKSLDHRLCNAFAFSSIYIMI